jgi:hypothetical protein
MKLSVVLTILAFFKKFPHACSMLLTSGMNALPTKLLLALTAVAALSIAHPAKANLIQNPGFEDNFIGWTFFAGSGVTALPANVHSGNFAGVLLGSSAFISQSVATTTGATYTIDFFAKAAGGAGSHLSVNFGSTVFNYVFTGTGYTKLTFNATVSDASTNLSFHDATGGFLYLDDISVEPTGVGVPGAGTTASLLGCAFIGLAGLRRRLGC